MKCQARAHDIDERARRCGLSLPPLTISSLFLQLTLMSSSRSEKNPRISEEKYDLATRPQDCLACRVIGTAALGGVEIYALNMSSAHTPGSVVGKRIMAGVGFCEYMILLVLRIGPQRTDGPGFLVASALRWTK